MSTPNNFPMPNDRFPHHGGLVTVVASCDQENGQYVLLLLNPTPGRFYSVVHVNSDTLAVEAAVAFENIIPAAEAYSDAIGGY